MLGCRIWIKGMENGERNMGEKEIIYSREGNEEERGEGDEEEGNEARRRGRR